jgi:PAS domain S-box-containing protein
LAALKQGASDYLLKDRLARLGAVVRHAMEETRLRQESVRTLAALRRSEETHRNLVQAMSEGVAVQDRNGLITFMNRRACEMLGYTLGELVGKPATCLFDAKNQAVLREQMALRRNGARADYEIAWLRKDGASLNTIVAPRPRFDQQGNIVESVAVFTDITARKLAEEQLRLRSAALEAAGNAIFLTDLAGTILWANPAFGLLSGYAPAEIAGRKPNLVKSGAHDTAFYTALWETVLAGRVWHGQITNRSKDGRLYIAEQTIAPVKDAGGAITHFVTVQQDITAHRRALESLRLFRSLMDRSGETIEVIDPPTGRLLDVNEQGCRAHGYTREEYLRLTVFDFHPGLPRGQFEQNQRRMRQSGPITVEAVHRCKDGVLVPSEINLSLVNLDREYLVAIIRDMTERQQAEARVREQAALLDKAHDAILVRDLDHRIRYWNRSAERIYGWTAAEALGRRITELIHHAEAGFEAAAATTLAQGGWSGELHQLRKDGGEIVVDSSWTLVRDPDGRPVSFLSINSDITEKKKLAAQLLRAQRLDSIGTLTGGIAHDLNNILTPMLLAVELLRARHADPESWQLLGLLETNAQRGAQMLRQILAFGRGGGGAGRSVVSPALIAREVMQIVHDTFPKAIRLVPEIAGNLWPVTGDPTELHQVLLNLFVNARDAMPGGGTLSLGLENVVLDETYAGLNPESRPGPYVVLSVTDTGSGIPPALRERIFEPFFTTKAAGKGTGLGLSTVRALVKGHGGFVNLYSEPGKGSTFKVYLPATTTPVAAESVAVAGTGLPRGDNELLLLVDDEEPVREVARKTLERFGYRVLLATNGAEAVSLFALHREKIAAVITDMAMPVMDGAATIVALRTIDPAVKIIGSSGMGSGSHGAMSGTAGLGLELFIPKPYTAEVMLTTLRELLGRAEPPPVAE